MSLHGASRVVWNTLTIKAAYTANVLFIGSSKVTNFNTTSIQWTLWLFWWSIRSWLMEIVVRIIIVDDDLHRVRWCTPSNSAHFANCFWPGVCTIHIHTYVCVLYICVCVYITYLSRLHCSKQCWQIIIAGQFSTGDFSARDRDVFCIELVKTFTRQAIPFVRCTISYRCFPGNFSGNSPLYPPPFLRHFTSTILQTSISELVVGTHSRTI